MEDDSNDLYAIIFAGGIFLASLTLYRRIVAKPTINGTTSISPLHKVFDKPPIILITTCILIILAVLNVRSVINPTSNNSDEKKTIPGTNSDFIVPASNSFSESISSSNSSKEAGLTTGGSNYKNAVTIFCLGMDKDGKGWGFERTFKRETETGLVYVCVDNNKQEFASGKVILNVFRFEHGEYTYYNSINFKINPSWTYLYHSLKLSEPGEYEVDCYSETGTLISSGRFQLQ